MTTLVAARRAVSTLSPKETPIWSNPNAAGRQGALPLTKMKELSMRYVCLIYFDPQKVFNQSPEAAAVLGATGAHDAELEASGHLVMAQALTLPNEAVTVQVRDGKMSATDGPFMETKEMLGGFILIEARDLNEAVRIAAGIPFAKLGSVEVRPIVDFSKPRPKL
jgi:hypothetical protein